MGRALAAVAALGAAILVLSGCADTGGEQAPVRQVEVFSSWTTGASKRGLDAAVAVMDVQSPNTELTNSAVGASPSTLASRLQGHRPPDSFQTQGAAQLIDDIAGGYVRDLTSFFAENRLREALPPAVVALFTQEGGVYAVPCSVHRANVVWVNTAALAAAGIDPTRPPATIASWLADLKKLRAAGVPTPLAVPNSAPAQVELLENVLLAVLGADGYLRLWDGRLRFDAPRVATALAEYGALLSYATTDASNWRAAVDQVVAGDAAYTVGADWAQGEFDLQGQTYGSEFTSWPTPGTDAVFDAVVDGFTLTADPPHPDGAKAWLKTIASADGQKALNLAKGSIPARRDAAPTDYPAYQQGAIAAYQRDTIVGSLARGSLVPPSWLADITAAVGGFATTRDILALRAALVQAQESALAH